MEEFRESYVKQVERQLAELPKQQKQTMLDGLRQELEDDCAGLPIQPLPKDPPEVIARELMDAVDPAVRKRHSAVRKRLFWCVFALMLLLLIMALCCMCYMYHMIQEISGDYVIITIEEYPLDGPYQVPDLPEERVAVTD